MLALGWVAVTPPADKPQRQSRRKATAKED